MGSWPLGDWGIGRCRYAREGPLSVVAHAGPKGRGISAKKFIRGGGVESIRPSDDLPDRARVAYGDKAVVHPVLAPTAAESDYRLESIGEVPAETRLDSGRSAASGGMIEHASRRSTVKIMIRMRMVRPRNCFSELCWVMAGSIR